MASLKGNVILNGINTVTSVLFPIITFPYAARVLLPEGIGAVNFLNSIISYIVLFTSLGIPMYAVREVARVRDDIAKRNLITIEILLLCVFLCLGGYAIVWVLATFVPEIHSQAALFYVLSLSIVFTSVGANWFYQAIEDFKFITIRALIFRTLAAACLFIFVHTPKDLLFYGFIVVGSTIGSNILNLIYLRKHVSLRHIEFKNLKILRHLRPSVEVFVLSLITSLYIQLNPIMIGFISGDEAVGYFTAGTRISHIGLTLITSIGTVLLPRCSNLIETGEMEKFSKVIHKSLHLTQCLSYPITLGLMLLAVPVTIVFCGPEYYDAIPVLLLNAPVIVFISYTNLMGIQILYPMGKLKIVIWSVTGGAIVNLILNFIFIPLWGATGAAFATLIAELVVLVIQVEMGKSYLPFSLSDLFEFKLFSATIIMGVAVFLSTYWISENWLSIVVGVVTGVVIYGSILWKTGESLVWDFRNMIKSRLIKI